MEKYSEELMSAAEELAYLSDELGREADEDDCGFEDYIYQVMEGLPNFYIATGASRVVLILNDDSDYVLKTPIFGEVHYPAIKVEDGNWEYDYSREPEFTPWQNAEYSDNGDNYCETEVYLYEKAAEAGLADLFAGIEYLFSKGNRPVYASEKCTWYDFYGTGKDAPSADSITFLEKEYSAGHAPTWNGLGTRATAKFIDDYGIEITKKLLAFIREYRISDLHGDNIMISNRTGKVVISDYAGFNC